MRPNAEPVCAAPKAGADLRAARERLGWPLPDAAATLRIRAAYLTALEDGDLSQLPGNAYALGFLRSYARALGLDPEEMLRRFKAEAAEVSQRTELSFPAPVPGLLVKSPIEFPAAPLTLTPVPFGAAVNPSAATPR